VRLTQPRPPWGPTAVVEPKTNRWAPSPSGAVLDRPAGEHRLDVVLRAVDHARVAGPPDAVVERHRQPGEGPAGALELALGGAQAAQVQQLGGPRLQADRPWQARSVAAFQDGHPDPRQGEFGGEQQAGGPGAGDQDVDHHALLK
jgi:hypothetical protein